jgi:hypothetical protein
MCAARLDWREISAARYLADDVGCLVEVTRDRGFCCELAQRVAGEVICHFGALAPISSLASFRAAVKSYAASH